jgi:hypothetical protein
MPSSVSPGFATVKYAARFAEAPGVRLDVGVVGAEQLLHALERERLGDVDELAAAVVALTGQALGVLVRHHRAGRREHGRADEVLGGDQLQSRALALLFAPDRVGDRGVAARELGEGVGRDVRHAASHPSSCGRRS